MRLNTGNDTVTGRCGWLTAATAGLWLLLAGPAYFVAGPSGLQGLSIAAGLCLVPGWIVLILGGLFRQAESQSVMVLAGTGLRMLFVLVGTLAVQSALPNLGFREFIVWLLVFYLAMLLIETLLVLKQPQSSVEEAGTHTNIPKTAAR